MKCPSRFCPRIGLRTVFGIVLCEEATALVIVRLHGASGHKSKSQDCTDGVVSGDTLYGVLCVQSIVHIFVSQESY